MRVPNESYTVLEDAAHGEVGDERRECGEGDPNEVHRASNLRKTGSESLPSLPVDVVRPLPVTG
jgi:hypothetical protein